MDTRVFSDLEVGESAPLGQYTVSKDDIVTFAEAYTPHPYHTDEAAAEASHFGGITASGWHTLVLTANVYVTTFAPDVASVALAGLDGLRWRTPLRPGDTLSVRHEIVGLEPETGPDDVGLMRQRIAADNQDGELLLEMELQHFVADRLPDE